MKNNSPRKSAILKAKTEPIKAPYSDPLVCKKKWPQFITEVIVLKK